ncbi:hypothetical protein TNCV_546511 [Trichonephila clavipes]|nr:hypothetical protein TNCV_546511 [Trichonephila clavipes]
MPHIPRGRLDLLVALQAPLDLIILDLFFWGHLKLFVFETPAVTVDDLTTRNAVVSADIVGTPDLFECVQQSFVCRYRLCYYAASTLNDYCDNH